MLQLNSTIVYKRKNINYYWLDVLLNGDTEDINVTCFITLELIKLCIHELYTAD